MVALARRPDQLKADKSDGAIDPYVGVILTEERVLGVACKEGVASHSADNLVVLIEEPEINCGEHPSTGLPRQI